MDAHGKKMSCSNSLASSSLNENDPSEMIANSIVDRDPEDNDTVKERDNESDVICQINHSAKLKNSENETSMCVNNTKNSKDKEANHVHEDHYLDGSKNSESEVGHKLLKCCEHDVKASENLDKSNEEHQEILSTSSDEIQDIDNSKNFENGNLFLEDEQHINNLNENNGELEIKSPLCKDATKIETTEKQLVHEILEGPALSCANTKNTVVLDNNICSDESLSKNQSEDSQESQNINRASEEDKDKGIMGTFETDHIESSDTSALMKLAELACETNDTVASEMLKSYDNTLKVNDTNSPDLQNCEAVCNSDTTASEMENDESLPSNFNSNQEFDGKNRIDSVKGLMKDKIAVLDNLKISTNSSAKDLIDDNVKIIGSESGIESLISESLEDKEINSPAREDSNLTPGKNNDVQEILSNFHILNEKSKRMDANLNELGNGSSLLTDHVENIGCLSKSCNSLNIVKDHEICIKDSDVNEAKINLEQQESIEISQSKSNMEDIASINEQKEKLSSLEIKSNNDGVNEINSLPVSKDLVAHSKICIEEPVKNGIAESISTESDMQLNNEAIPIHNDPIEQSAPLRKDENLKINENKINSLPVRKDLVVHSKISIEEPVKNGIAESISAESDMQLNNEAIPIHNDPVEQSAPLRKEENLKINENSVTDGKLNLPVSSVNIKNSSDTYSSDVQKGNLVSSVYCEEKETTKDLFSKISLEEKNKGIENNSNYSKENMSYPSVEKTSHSSTVILDQKSFMEQKNSLSSSTVILDQKSFMEQKNSLSSVMEENSHTSGIKNDLCSSERENKSQTSLVKDITTRTSNIQSTDNIDSSLVSNIPGTSLKESTLHSTLTQNNNLNLALTSSSNSCSSKTYNNVQLSVKENISHSSETEKDLQSSVIENDSHSSEFENNFHSSVTESNSNSSEMESSLHPSVKEKDSQSSKVDNNINLSMKENHSHSSEMEDNFHPSLKDDLLSSEMENSLHNSVVENDSYSEENNGPTETRANSPTSELKTDSHSSITKNTVNSLYDENPDSSLNMTIKKHDQIVSNSSSSCPKIYIRKDLHEGYCCDDSESIKNSLNKKINPIVTDTQKTSVRFTENIAKRALSVTDENRKRMCNVLDLTCIEDSSDEDKLIIDEERANLKYVDQFSKDKSQTGKVYKSKNKKPNSNLKNQNPAIHCENGPQPVSITSNIKPMVEVVDLVGEDLNENSINKSSSNLNNDKNFICEKCKNIWNDKTLKLLFEGNESVTVNSRITYGAIICMNIYVSIHYPKIKEQALLGLLDRADLAKNLGSIQVSLLNNWLVALIKNKKISCCDPFRPVYRAKTPNQVHHSDKALIGNKELDDRQKRNVESSVRERNLEPAAIKTCSTAEIVIDDDNDLNQDHDERNVQYVDSGTSLAIGKYHIKKAGSSLKTGSTVIDSVGSVITNGKAFTKQFAKSNPISYSIIQRERESLSSDLHDAYNKLVYDSKLTEEEAVTGKRKILTNKEILCLHSIFILNAKEILLDKYYRFLFQLLYHRGNILLIPDEKSLVQRIENIRKERNRMKFSVAKNKAFLSQSWDIDNICTAPVAKPVNKKNEFNVKVQDILSVFCAWKNRKLLNGNTDAYDLREEILKLYENKIGINDCFGLCIKLYANYSRLLFSQNETENMKTKVFLNLFYLPNKYLSSLENTLIFDPEITYFPPTNGNSSDIIDYLEKQTKKGSGPVKRSYLDSVIDAKLQQAKRLKTDLLNSVKTPKAISLIESYAKLKNEMNYLEVEPASHQSFKSTEDSQEENLIKSLTYTPEVKLMVAKLRASNVDTEYIPIILEKVFHNIFKRKIPTL
ncbi:UNVERIFIED_CONTAM: hypothetical protein RMT77_004602 [Armadillidium vulgare]